MRAPGPLLLALALGAAASAPAARAGDTAEALFADHCAACHGEAGVGIPGLAPPLHSPELAALTPEQAAYVPLVILNGLSGPITSAGQRYMSVMPRVHDLSDAEIAALTGLVLGWNGVQAPPLAPEGVAALRAEPKTAALLRQLRKAAP